MQHMESAAADVITAAIAADPRGFSPTKPEKKPMASKTQIIQKMADALINSAAVLGGATEQALLGAGFTHAQIEAHGEEAADKARSIQTT